jgi:hypothetical protein
MHAESLPGGSLAGGSLARKTEKGTKRTLTAYLNRVFFLKKKLSVKLAVTLPLQSLSMFIDVSKQLKCFVL